MPLASLTRRIRSPLLAALLAAGLLAPGAAGAQLTAGRFVGSGEPLHRAGVISPDLRWAATLDQQAGVWLWNARTGEPVWHFPRPHGERASFPHRPTLAFSPDGGRLAVSMRPSAELWVLDVPSGRQLAHFVHTPPGVYTTPWGATRLYDFSVDALAFSPDGATLAAASAGRVIAWDLALADTLWSVWLPADPFLGAGRMIHDLRFAPGGHVVAVATLAHGVELLDARTGAAVGRIAPGTDVASVVFSPDGRLVATDRCEAVDVWALDTGARVVSIPVGRCGHELAVSPDSRLLVGGSGYAGYHAWHLPTGEHVQTLYPPEDRTTVAAFAFSADGRRLLELAEYAAYRLRTWTLSHPAAP